MSTVSTEIAFPERMPLKQRVFISEFIKDFNGTRAAEVVGFKEPAKAAERMLDPIRSPVVVAVIRQYVNRIEATNDLKAEYVRDYLYTVMEFKPGLYFKPSDGGGWSISEEAYNFLPEKIQRLVEEVEVREVSRVNPQTNETTTARFLWVKFVSKTTAMVTAARYTLTSLTPPGEAPVDFDKLMQNIVKKRVDRAIQTRIEAASKALPALIDKKIETQIPTPSTNGHKENGDGR